jgi:hypothetical protein
MKITVTPTGGKPLVLGDDSIKWAISGFAPDQERNVQIGAGTRAPYIECLGRDNRRNQITFRVDRTHSDYAAATIYAMTHHDEVPIIGLVEISQQFSGGIKRLWYANAGISNVRCDLLDGVTTVFSYTITAGQALTTKPTA